MFRSNYLKLLIFFCFICKAYAASFCDLKEGINFEVAPFQLHETSYTKFACIASEDCRFPPEFLEQTKKMMEREAYFRHKCGVKDSTNIAQLCIYGMSASKCQVLETFNTQACKGHFYLSGSDPVSLHLAQERKGAPSPLIDIQKVPHEKGYIEIRQRPQPLLSTIGYTIRFLVEIQNLVENPTPRARDLAEQAACKDKEISVLIDKKNEIIRQLVQQVARLEVPQDKPLDIIEQHSQQCMSGIFRELITCLESNDFNFNGMKDAKNNENIKGLIATIHNTLSERKLCDLLNSKYFNLGCSEPVLLQDMLVTEINRIDLISKISRNLAKDRQLHTVIIQLHSTKTPCRSCLIGCCGHLRDGVIKTFFQELSQELGRVLKRNDINLRFLISYHAPYEDDYPFLVPVATDLNFPLNSILLVNMQFYDEQFKKTKERIAKEFGMILLQKAAEKGSLNVEDIKALLKL